MLVSRYNFSILCTIREYHTHEFIQVYTLEKVLKVKKDPVSQALFLDEAMKVSTSLLCGRTYDQLHSTASGEST